MTRLAIVILKILTHQESRSVAASKDILVYNLDENCNIIETPENLPERVVDIWNRKTRCIAV
jgi:hypothetical protein